MTKLREFRPSHLKDSALASAIEQIEKLLAEDSKAKIAIVKPAAGASLVLPVDLEASWTRSIKPGSFRAAINGEDFTALFRVDEAAMKATALGVRIGDPACDDQEVEDMALTVSAQMPKNLPKPGAYKEEATCNFKLAGPAYAVVANAVELQGATPHPNYQPSYRLDVARGSTAMLRLTIEAFNAFLSDVVVDAYASRPPQPPIGSTVAGIQFNTPLRIAAGAGKGFLRIAVDSKLDCGDYAMALVCTAPADRDHGAAQLVAVHLMVHSAA
jgi:hypothetical protein